MVKLRWLKEWKIRKIGDISNVAEKSAENFVNQGYAEYVEKPKKEKVVKKKEESTKRKIKQAAKKINTETEIPKKLLDILKNPNLFNLITGQEFDKKIVGEVEARKVIFLSCQGRLVENCQTASFNLLVNDDAGIGKDYIVGAVLEIIPKEYYIHKTKISPSVFTYWKPVESWNGIIFYPEDISESVLNSDVFKVMCSKGSSATIVIKQQAVEIEIEGKPVMITTTATSSPNPELTRRYSFLNLDSTENQTKSILKRHSEFKKEGIIPEYNQDYIEAQRYLKRAKVKIPFADLIDEHFPTKNIIMRTNYPRFLDYICASTCFFQFQRTEEEGFLLAEGQDYDLARECFLKLCSNKYMIPLTINQKKMLGFFEKNPNKTYSASQFHAEFNIMSLKSVGFNFGILTKYGILQSDIEKDSLNRDIEVYSLANSYNPNDNFDLPKYEEIIPNDETK